MTKTQRKSEVDVIRLVALVGICVVNIPFMALPLEAVFEPPTGWPNKSVALFVESVFQLKFFLLFSFIFGWGMAIQARLAESAGQSFVQRYFRRLAGLAVLGAAHAVLVFNGDILVLYAVLGTFLWFVKDRPPRALMILSAWMIPLSMASLTALAFLIDSVSTEALVAASSSGVKYGGSYFQDTAARLSDWPSTFVFLMLLQGPLAFGAFAAGLAAAKSDFFTSESVGFKLLRRWVPRLFVIALPLNVLYAAVIGGVISEEHEVLSLLGFTLITIGAPAMSAIYLYLFIQLSRKIKLPDLLVLAGQNSLSTYIIQGVLAGFVFGAYGLGWYNTLEHALLLPLSLSIALSAMVFVGGYAKFFGRGPLEPVLRLITG